MRAELINGEIVALARECNCATHHEPHWVHMWRLDRDMILGRIRPLLEKMDAIKATADASGGRVSFSDFIAHEQAKLAVSSYVGDMARIYGDALREFKVRGIARLIAEASDKPNDIELQRARDYIKTLLPEEPEISPYLDKQTEVRMKAREAV
jgi:hypothetical protein